MTSEGLESSAELPDQEQRLARGLSSRHIQFIAIGGAIGGSLFLGSGAGIRAGGPSILIAYVIAGLSIYLMARAMGELVLGEPAPSFSVHVDRYVGPWAGFVTGWSYWLLWVLVSIFELTAIGLLLRFWFPHLPTWIPALTTVASLYIANRITVRLFGELEFWLTLIKIVTILVLVLGGGTMALLHLGPLGQEASVAKLWNDGGPFPTGMAGFLAVVPLAFFAFGGTELIGITAAEAMDPEHSVPRAINGVILRIAVFYLGSLAVIMMVAGWRTLDPSQSPFVLVFERAGFPAAANIVNLVVVTAIISSMNSGIFATARMLYSLALQGDAPGMFARLDRRRIPVTGVNVSTAAMLGGVGLNYLFPDRIFSYIMSLITALLLWTWAMILVSHARYRQSVTCTTADAAYAVPFSPWSNRLVLLILAGVTALMAMDAGARTTLYTFAGWFAAISLAYRLSRA
jgi:AAT family amino acid transporter